MDNLTITVTIREKNEFSPLDFSEARWRIRHGEEEYGGAVRDNGEGIEVGKLFLPVWEEVVDAVCEILKGGRTAYELIDAFDAIEVLPAADVAPVVRGKWKYYHKKNKAVCTVCSFERDLDANFGRAVVCPNCGAKMDKED